MIKPPRVSDRERTQRDRDQEAAHDRPGPARRLESRLAPGTTTATRRAGGEYASGSGNGGLTTKVRAGLALRTRRFEEGRFPTLNLNYQPTSASADEPNKAASHKSQSMNGANKTRPVFTRRARSLFSAVVCTGRAACWPSRVAPCPDGTTSPIYSHCFLGEANHEQFIDLSR